MKKMRVSVTVATLKELPGGRIDEHRVDATTEHDIARQQKEDDALAMQDSAKFAQRVRKRLGMTQLEFSNCIEVPLETIRNWEQGKRCPTGAAKTLLKILNRTPEIALMALC
jgi:putative transcriptional regulator